MAEMTPFFFFLNMFTLKSDACFVWLHVIACMVVFYSHLSLSLLLIQRAERAERQMTASCVEKRQAERPEVNSSRVEKTLSIMVAIHVGVMIEHVRLLQEKHMVLFVRRAAWTRRMLPGIPGSQPMCDIPLEQSWSLSRCQNRWS